MSVKPRRFGYYPRQLNTQFGQIEKLSVPKLRYGNKERKWRILDLLLMAEKRWRKVNSAHLVLLVQAGVKFPDGKTKILPDLPSNSTKNLPANATLELAIHNI